MLSQGVNRGADPEAGRPHRYSAEQPESRCLLCSGAAGLKVRELEVSLHPTRRALLAASPRVAPSLDTRVCAVQLAPCYCLQQRNRRKETALHLELRKGLPSCVWHRASWKGDALPPPRAGCPSSAAASAGAASQPPRLVKRQPASGGLDTKMKQAKPLTTVSCLFVLCNLVLKS